MRHRIRSVEPVVPTASMADIAFLLIIFFMLTTSFNPVKISVDLPESEVRVDVTKDAAIVAVTGDGRTLVSDGEAPGREVATLDELSAFVLDIVSKTPEKQFVIRADRNVQYQFVDQVLDRLRIGGAKNIGLLTEQRAEPLI